MPDEIPPIPTPGAITESDIKLDLYHSTFTRGADNFYGDRALRRGFIKGNLGNTDQDLWDCVNAVLIKVGEFHHADETLPLSSVRAVRFGPNKANVELYYSRVPDGRQTNAKVQADPITGMFIPTFVYRESTGFYGFPDGPIYGQANINDFDEKPRGWVWPRPAIRFSMPAYLPSNPVHLAGLTGTTNVGITIIDGFAYGQNVLRFDSFSSRYVRTPFGNRWMVQYNFTAAWAGWLKQVTRFVGGEWTTALVREHASLWTINNFPFHYEPG